MAELPTIELDAYVKETLLAIVRGVAEAQKDPDLGGMIGRSHVGKGDGGDVAKDQQENAISNVRFDLATTVQDKAGVDGKARVKVVGLEVGGGGSTEATSSLVSRLSFTLPIAIPKPEAQKAEEHEAARRQSEAMRRAAAASRWS